MIKKICAFLLPSLLLVALFLKLNGVDRIVFDNTYYEFFSRVLQRNTQFTIEIPNIPSIPIISNTGIGWDILKVLVNFANGFVNILNVLVLILNTIISVLQFVLNIIIQCISELRRINLSA